MSLCSSLDFKEKYFILITKSQSEPPENISYFSLKWTTANFLQIFKNPEWSHLPLFSGAIIICLIGRTQVRRDESGEKCTEGLLGPPIF